MKKLIIITSIVFLNLSAKSQIVSIPDTNFLENLISWGWDTNKDGQIQIDEAKAVTNLLITNPKVKDLTGIEAFSNLLSLDCSGALISTLNLRKNSKLTGLICDNNILDSIDITQNFNLKTLWCPSNRLKSLNLTNNTELTTLECSFNQITQLKLNNNTKLTSLNCSMNQLTELNISNNTLLTGLSCNNNYLIELNVRYNLLLNYIHCQNNLIETLDVSMDTVLTYLNSEGNPLLSQICINKKQFEKLGDTRSWRKDDTAQWNTTCGVVTGIKEETMPSTAKTLVRIVNSLGQFIEPDQAINGVFIYQYSDGSTSKIAK